MAYGHTTLSTPDLVRSRKLSSVGPVWYLDGRPPGNTRCCKLFFFSKRSRTIVPFSVGGSSSSACLPACPLGECARCPGTCQPGQRMGRVLQRMAKVIQLRARLPFVRTIEREGGS